MARLAHIERATRDGADRDARLNMMSASMQGALAFQKGLGCVHSLSHSLGGIDPRLHHGTLNAIFLPAVIAFNEEAASVREEASSTAWPRRWAWPAGEVGPALPHDRAAGHADGPAAQLGVTRAKCSPRHPRRPEGPQPQDQSARRIRHRLRSNAAGVAVVRRRALLALLASAPLLPTLTHAQDNAALNDAAKDAVTAFLKALRNEDMDAAMKFVAAPFVAEDAQIFATEAEVKAYLTAMCLELPAAEMPNEVLAILDYDQSRAATAPAALKLRDTVLTKGDLLVATGRNGLSRGVLLVKANGGKPVVVGVGLPASMADFGISGPSHHGGYNKAVQTRCTAKAASIRQCRRWIFKGNPSNVLAWHQTCFPNHVIRPSCRAIAACARKHSPFKWIRRRHGC